MWAAPLILPNLADPSQSYALLTQHLLPSGLIGLVLAGIFAHTMAMTSSDANAVASVITRDILPFLSKRAAQFSDKAELLNGRVFVFLFIGTSMLIAVGSKSFGGVIGLIILWYGALIGPIAIPMLFGMLPMFRRCGSVAALSGWGTGVCVFILVKYVFNQTIVTLHPNWVTTCTVAGPVACSMLVFVIVGLIKPQTSVAVDRLIASLDHDVILEQSVDRLIDSLDRDAVLEQ
jgi:SSS family solute:Na+ symporter